MRAASFSEKSKLSIFIGYYKPHWKLFLLDLSCALGIDLIAFTLYVNAFLQPIKKLVSFFEQYTTGMGR